ncbi:hypothetical protein Aspvir_008739 [Aspergillus viridinutans]|uniref:Uncharacterized protein n=1 Tax=Aspergillus viridinutans TaxID=75553 RepID=A0A9P3C3U0_ASPVI|nr:uncharacterized protein Aspvir_008739 [Aspergillus viridinutans]GIK04656.1 hypothetical protein Aspvir_008739 [Aspergillus viridinutans]
MDDTYFPDELWLNREIQFTSPSTSAWKLTVKINENIGLLSKQESEDYQATSSSIAEFECHRSSDPTQQARVAIYMQIPNKGTQALPPDMRRRQASDEVPKSLQEEHEAYERLASHHFTPQLVGFKHEKQDVNGLVPDGFVSYIAYTKVPGVALGLRTYRFGDGSDIPDVNVASDAPSTRKPGQRITQYSIPEGLFWTMRRSERDLIRDKFNLIYSYIDGVFVPTDGMVTSRPRDVGSWGLAVFPDRHNKGLQDKNDTDFVAAGWIL